MEEVKAHATLSASGAERWMACPGSVKAEEGLPDSSTVHAYEGTCAHKLAEVALTNGVPPEEFLGETLELEAHEAKGYSSTFEVTQEMVDYVTMYVDYVNDLPGEHFIETRLDYSKWVPEGFGTSDHTALDTHDYTLYVTDLKYGKGVKKYAKGNPQIMLYALGAYDNFSWMGEITRVVMCIHQPRIDHVDTHEISVKALMKFAKKAKKAAKKTAFDEPPLVPGKIQCLFCKAKKSAFGCAAYEEFVREEALMGIDVLEEGVDLAKDLPVDKLSPIDLSRMLQAKEMVDDYFKVLQARGFELVKQGVPCGLKAVQGRRPNASWKEDDEAILAKLKHIKGLPAKDVQVVKPITPTQAFKVVPGGKEGLFIQRNVDFHDGEGKLTLVPLEDKREAVNMRAELLDSLPETPNE